MATFKLKSGPVYLENVNPRKEKAGKDPDGALAADLKFKLRGVPASLLKAVAPVEPGSSTTIVDSLFDEKGNPRFREGFGTINFHGKFDEAVVTVSGKKFGDSKLKDFIVERTMSGRKVDLSFTAQIHPTDEQVGYLCGKMKQEVMLAVEGGSLQRDIEDEEEEEDAGDNDNQGDLTLIQGGKDGR